jgi:hypothetical protein
VALLLPPLLAYDQLLLDFALRPKLARPVFVKKDRLVDTRRPSRCGKLRLINRQVERHFQLPEGGRVLIGIIERAKVRLAPLPVSRGCARGDKLGFEFGLVVLFGRMSYQNMTYEGGKEGTLRI